MAICSNCSFSTYPVKLVHLNTHVYARGKAAEYDDLLERLKISCCKVTDHVDSRKTAKSSRYAEEIVSRDQGMKSVSGRLKSRAR